MTAVLYLYESHYNSSTYSTATVALCGFYVQCWLPNGEANHTIGWKHYTFLTNALWASRNTSPNGPFSSGGQKWALTGVVHGNTHVIVLSCTHYMETYMFLCKCVHESTVTCMFPCITPVSAHFWPPLEKGPLLVCPVRPNCFSRSPYCECKLQYLPVYYTMYDTDAVCHYHQPHQNLKKAKKLINNLWSNKIPANKV